MTACSMIQWFGETYAQKGIPVVPDVLNVKAFLKYFWFIKSSGLALTVSFFKTGIKFKSLKLLKSFWGLNGMDWNSSL